MAKRFVVCERRDVPLEGASDHGVSEALYLRDPDGNGIELYWDRPRSEWPREQDGTIRMVTERLDLNDAPCRCDADAAEPERRFPVQR